MNEKSQSYRPGLLLVLWKELLVLSKILGNSFGIGLHCLLAWLPSGWADFSVFVGELESLNKTNGLVDISANGKVVDGDLK